MSSSLAAFVTTRDVPLDELTPYPGNAKRGDVDAIRKSLRRNGQYRSLVVREVEHGPLIVLAGNHTMQALTAEGHATARCEIVRCDDATARRINLADNRTGDLGTYDERALAELLVDMNGDLDGTGYTDDEIESLTAALSAPDWEAQRAADDAAGMTAAAPEARSVRGLPLDAHFSMGGMSSIAVAAYEMGFQPGIISTARTAARDLATWLPKARIGFMDNEWHGYDHTAHLAAVAEVRPKYATVRDAMTKQQCEEAGVEYIPLPQILEYAAELAQHADHVIVIPKYDCLAEIPEEFVLGYSVHTSYGGTPLPISAFAGRRIHLLGGSWPNQRRFLALMGDDVVSFDNNHLLRIAEFGNFTFPDGTNGSLATLDERMPRTWQAAAILSLASIRDELRRMFGANLAPLVGDDTPPPPPGNRDDDEDETPA